MVILQYLIGTILTRNYREWIWTAITRCRDLNKVKFFKYNTDKNDEFNYKCMMSYYERKIANYKEQDRKAKRKIPKEGYVNIEWFLDNIKNQCNYCGCGFFTTMNNGNITTNLTCQRVNNEYTHTLDNIVAYCKRCNLVVVVNSGYYVKLWYYTINSPMYWLYHCWDVG